MLLTALLAACAPEGDGPSDCTPVAWYADLDGDGFGASEDVVTACASPGRVEVAGDCDDADDASFPGAPESCADTTDRDCDGTVPQGDQDADGWAACRDCDDGNASRNPGAPEVCDKVDDDCDGEIDEDATDAIYVYADQDGDGYGDPSVVSRSCTATHGHAASGDDCDDTDATVNPEAVEACNDRDDDCDGTIDDAEDLEAWYDDLDGDGWGDDATAVRTCSPTDGQVAVGGDCDDDDPDVSPGALEVCDGGDEDCDGHIDEDDAFDAPTWYDDDDGDGWGYPGSARTACVAPVSAIARGADCDDNDAGVFPNADELCNGHDDDCDLDIDEEDAVDATVWFADADGDGWGGADLYAIGCSAPPDHYASSEDCDDTDATVSPDAIERCDGIDDDCDGAVDEASASDVTTWYADADGDAYGDPGSPVVACDAPAGTVADGTDCDDRDAALSPGAPERCDLLDQDCDGLVDEDAVDAVVTYADLDADGWGDPYDVRSDCAAPEDRVEEPGDCDDTDDAVHPAAVEDCDAGIDANCDGYTGYDDNDGDGTGACLDCDDGDATRSPGEPERCDAVDQDCDGELDEDAVDATTWHADTDGDGFGDPLAGTLTCAAPDGTVADDTDCDDGDAGVSPAAVETCVTTADDDCSGTTNDEDALSCSAFYLDYDGDGSGSLSARCLCAADGLFAADTSEDCDDGDASISPDLPELWANAQDDDCDEDIDTLVLDGADRVLYGLAGQDNAGDRLAAAGDADGDGLEDLLISAPGADTNGSAAGDVYLVFGGGTGNLDLARADAVFHGEAAGDELCGAAGRDLDGDGFADVFVGGSEAGSSLGGAWLFRGPVTGSLEMADADTTVAGETPGDRAGVTIALADLDGDGVGDMVLGGTGDDDGGSAAGAVWGVFVPSADGVRLSSADVKILGEDAADRAGTELDAGDLDGDGFDDLVIGAVGDDDNGADAGAVYLLRGPISGFVDLANHDGKYLGEYANDQVGEVARITADLNGDGRRDLLIGATGNGIGGAVWAYAGPGAPFIHTTSEVFASWTATDTADELGSAVAGPGDLDGDGWNDLAIGADHVDADATNGGAVYVWFGPLFGSYAAADADTRLYGADAGDYAGGALASPGDTDGDGAPDLLVGAIGADDGGSNAGAAYLFLGPG